MATSNLSRAQLEKVILQLRASGITPTPQLVDQYVQQYLAHQMDEAIQRIILGSPSPEPPPQPEKRESTVSDEQLPKQELLLKLLKMTTSSNDGEALTAIRKVNTMLTANGWDWDKFVSGKIKIVENPFVNLGTPMRAAPRPSPFGSSPPPPPPTPPPAAKLAGQRARSLGVNKFADHCYCCGIEVMAQAGGFFNPTDYNLNARSPNLRSKFAVICASCDGKQMVWDQPAPPLRKRGKASINDLA